MDIGVVLTVATVWCVAALTPGPNFFITVHTAIGAHHRLSRFTVLGIVVGTMVWAVSGFLGVTLLFQASPILYLALKTLGGLYLIYLGYTLLFKNKKVMKSESCVQRSAMDCFRLGLLTNLLNPKTAAFMTSLFAATIPKNATPELGLVCIICICLISALWYSLVAAAFTRKITRRMYNNHYQRVERIAGALFIGFGGKLLISE